jgi:hypothetical protein
MRAVFIVLVPGVLAAGSDHTTQHCSRRAAKMPRHPAGDGTIVERRGVKQFEQCGNQPRNCEAHFSPIRLRRADATRLIHINRRAADLRPST